MCFPGEEDIPVAAGDILIIPHGDAHTVSNGSPSTFIDSGASLGKYPGGRSDDNAAGRRRRADPIRLRLFRLRTSCRPALPCRPAADDQDQPAGRPGRRMAGELGSPSCLRGWIRATGTVGPALQDGGSALHRNHPPLHGGSCRRNRPAGLPVRGIRSSAAHWRCCTESPVIIGPWSELAAETGVSRSVLAERFSRFLGEPPLTYLARWRLQLAARMLQTTREAVIQVASEVGYNSEAAFNRAFKREFGVPPGEFRGQFRRSCARSDWLEATGQLAFPRDGVRGIKRYPRGVPCGFPHRSAGSGLPVDQSPSRLSGSASGKCCCDPLLFGAMRSQGLV